MDELIKELDEAFLRLSPDLQVIALEKFKELLSEAVEHSNSGLD